MSNLIKPPNDGGPAFPLNNFTYPNGQTEIGFNGMTLRDWFAGQALQGLLASGHFTLPPCGKDGAWLTTHEDPFDDETGYEIHHGRYRFDFPEAAWRCADAMIKAREENP